MYKVGDTLVCIDNIGEDTSAKYSLTIGKKYEALYFPLEYVFVRVRDNNGYTRSFDMDFFISLSEYRKLKIGKICAKLSI